MSSHPDTTHNVAADHPETGRLTRGSDSASEIAGLTLEGSAVYMRTQKTGPHTPILPYIPAQCVSCRRRKIERVHFSSSSSGKILERDSREIHEVLLRLIYLHGNFFLLRLVNSGGEFRLFKICYQNSRCVTEIQLNISRNVNTFPKITEPESRLEAFF